MTELLERPDGAPCADDMPVCRHCGSDDLASVEVAGYWQSVSIVPDDDADDPWTTGDDWSSHDSSDGVTVGVVCRSCDRVASDEHRDATIAAAAAALVEAIDAGADPVELHNGDPSGPLTRLVEAVKAPTWRYSDLLMSRRDWDALPDRQWYGSVVYWQPDTQYSEPLPVPAIVEAPTEYLAGVALVARAQARWRELGIPAASWSADQPVAIYIREAVPVDGPAA